MPNTLNSNGISLWHNANIATCDERMHLSLSRRSLVVRDGRIAWVGPAGEEPRKRSRSGVARHDLRGAWVTPGLIDCHTHLVFAGTRAPEYAERLRGVSYAEIAARGGGILTTMRATRQASLEQLIETAAPRLESLLAEGVTRLRSNPVMDSPLRMRRRCCGRRGNWASVSR